MTPNEFERIVSADPALSAPVRSAAAAMPHSRETFGAPGELVAIAALLPVVTFVVKGVGLPWLYEAKRYTDIWRLKFHKWVDTQYRKHGLDPDAAEAAGEALRKELQAITDAGAKASWQRLADLLSDDGPAESEDG